MSSLKSTPRRIVTNFFFGLNAACKPPRRPHSNTPPASQPFPSRPEGAEAPSPGQSPWGITDATLTPCFTLIEQALSVFFNVNYI